MRIEGVNGSLGKEATDAVVANVFGADQRYRLLGARRNPQLYSMAMAGDDGTLVVVHSSTVSVNSLDMLRKYVRRRLAFRREWAWSYGFGFVCDVKETAERFWLAFTCTKDTVIDIEETAE